jgi:hypothetical protein
MKIENVGMSQIQVHYEANKLSVESGTRGSLFQGGNQPFFITDNDTQNGCPYHLYHLLGPDGNAVGGTGDIALIHFKPKSSGQQRSALARRGIFTGPPLQTKSP